jgi:peptidyl-prolyl cis-trans isomerase SurA
MLNPDCRSFLSLAFAAAVLTGACRSTPGAPASQPPISPDVWATVDGREIRRETVEKAYRRLVQPNQASSEDETLAAKLNLLDRMITEEILLTRSRELKIEVPASDLDAAFNEGKKNIPDDAFNKELASRNLSAADMRDATGRDLMIQKLIEREVTSKISVTAQDIDAFFQANKARFNLPEDAYHIAQIVVTPGRDAGLNNRTGDDATTPQAAVAKAKMLMERLKAGAPFNEMAMDYSEDPQSAAQGGDVGLVPVSALSQVPPQLRDAVVKAKPGTVDIVSMGGGFTIVALVARQSAGQRDPSMPELRDSITATLRGGREQLLRAAYVETAREKATVVNYLARRLVESAGKPPSMPAPLAPK